jgi:hypothetical protein
VVMMNNQYWPAIILILIGVLLLFYQTDLLDFSTADLISYGFILIGAIFLIKGLNRTDKRGILGGVFFSTFGITMILMREYVLPRNDEFGFAAFFLALALGNFVYLPFKKDKSTNLIWGIVFGALGALFLWAHYGYYPSWYIYDQIALYWPVIFIVIGAIMIIKGYIRSRDREEVGIQSP